MAERRRRVAVLGGGAAGLAAAWELTATPELRERFDVTVYQLGWRLGGKGASGRQAHHGQRIVEHGLHIWFGWYQESFDLMAQCYEEVEVPGLPSWSDAFEPRNDWVLMENWKGKWYPRRYVIPAIPGQPAPSDEEEAVRAAAAWLDHASLPLKDELACELEGESQPPPWAGQEPGGLGIPPIEGVAWEAQLPGRFALAATPPPGTEGLADRAVAAAAGLARAVGALRDRLLRKRLSVRDLFWLAGISDLIAALARGLVDDGLLSGECSFEDFDDKELTEWLSRHGFVHDWRTVPFLRGLYDLPFAWEEGRHGVGGKPNGAAGMAVRNLLRLAFGHRGGFMWKMQAGMGDAVFAPLYLALKKRGVRFRFFHWVTEVGPDHVQVVEQVQLEKETYDPLVEVRGLRCWPAQPRWDQLAEPAKLKPYDLERELGPVRRPPATLERGKEFDLLVLALPAGVHKTVCAPLCAADGCFKDMVAAARTVATRAL